MRIRMFAAAFAVAVVATIPLAGAASAQDRDCASFRYQEDAQEYFDSKGYSADNDPERLDDAQGNGNGVACEDRPKRPVTNNDTSDQVTTVPRGGVDTGDGTTTSAPMLITVVGAAAAAGIGGFAMRRAASSSR